MQHTERFLKRRKFLLFLPLIVWPFGLLIFWLLGGGSAYATIEKRSNGLNMQLPDAKVEKLSALDKLSFYAMASKDSVKRVELEKMDPNLDEDVEEEVAEVSREKINRVRSRVYQPAPEYEVPVVKRSADIEKLQDLVQTLQQPRVDNDMETLNETLQQLVAFQQPKAVLETVNVLTRKVFAVHGGINKTVAGFYGESVNNVDTGSTSTIKAVVHGEQTIQTASVIKLRLMTDMFVGHERIPAGSFVFGSASIGNERMNIEISSIQYNGRIYPVALTVVDMDGMEGIYIPGSTTREVVKQAAEQGVQSIGLISMDQSMKGQVAAAGIGTAKTLLGRKAARVRVTIKSGYQLLLRDEKRRDE